MVTVSTSKAYHHGDLRAALIDAGLKALETTSAEDLSLRQIAREVGVSATAVYRHFPDKTALLEALAGAGIEQMARWQQNEARTSGADEAFAATGRAYVRWAIANPALFRLVFTHCPGAGESIFGSNTAAQLLRGYAQQSTGTEDSTQRLMLQAWALVHGLAMLILDGQLPADDALINRVIDARTLFPRSEG